MKKCDVIVPIYNAYDCLEPLILSLKKNTDLNENRIILIDDKSPDNRVLPLLKKYSNGDNIILLENKENLGFVGTVNRGMKYSKNDVILLNSDTEVTPNWLDKIKKCAYSYKKISTVTPLSNNATLVSVPIGLQRNELPKGMSLEEYSNLIEKVSYNDYPGIVTGHGFCLFIKREVLDIVGYFDEETFGKGYGEENDFCYRCLNYGYKNIICDNTIIYHKESQSFSKKRADLIEQHMKIIDEKYHIYKLKNEYWCGIFPIQYICKNIEYSLDVYNKKNIMYVIHDWRNISENVGGTSLHLYDLIMNMNDKYNFFVLTRENNYKLYSYINGVEKVLDFHDIFDSNILQTHNLEYKEFFYKIVKSFNIGLVHVHHMIGHYLDLIDVLNELKIPSFITLHDFYSICPTINLLYNNEKYCMDLKEKKCDNCLKNRTGICNNIIGKWQESWYEFLMKFDKVIVPSNSTKEIINVVYPKLKIKVIEHGIDYVENDVFPTNETKKLNIAFIGVMSVHKGGRILESLVNNKKLKNVNIHLFGKSEIKTLEKSHGNYYYHGRYKKLDLVDLLKENNIQLICMFPIWPETYSYTLTEAIAAGIPVLTYDIGAIGERVKKYNFGWVLPYTNKSISNIEKEIIKIHNNKNDYKEKINSIKKYHIKSIKEMCDEYDDEYKTYKNNDSEENIEIRKKLFKNLFLSNPVNVSLESTWILNSLKWKIVSKIDPPEWVKKIGRKIYRR